MKPLANKDTEVTILELDNPNPNTTSQAMSPQLVYSMPAPHLPLSPTVCSIPFHVWICRQLCL